MRRLRATLDHWFGHLGVELHAEHYRWRRRRDGGWRERVLCGDAWMSDVYSLLEQVARERSGAFVETKDRAVVLHHRAVNDPVKPRWLQALQGRLEPLLRGHRTVRVESGNGTLEARPASLSKRVAVEDAVAERGPGELLVAIGDDVADEDMFRAIEGGDVAIRVGGGPTCAHWELADFRAVRRGLTALIGT